MDRQTAEKLIEEAKANLMLNRRENFVDALQGL